jgi:hypothetical protein
MVMVLIEPLVRQPNWTLYVSGEDGSEYSDHLYDIQDGKDSTSVDRTTFFFAISLILIWFFLYFAYWGLTTFQK